MTDHTDLIENLRSKINPAYADVIGTESYERKVCLDAIEALVKELDGWKACAENRLEIQRMREGQLAAIQHVVAQYAEGERKLRAELVKTRLEASLDYNTLFGELQVALEELAALRKQIDELQPVAYFDDDTSTLTFNKTIPGHAWKPVYLLEGIKK